MCGMRLAENAGPKKVDKNRHLAQSHNFVGMYLRNQGTYRQSEKNLLSSNISSTRKSIYAIYMWVSAKLSVWLSVGWSVAIVSCAKTAEPIEMPFGIWTRVVSGKHVLGVRGCKRPGILTGKRYLHGIRLAERVIRSTILLQRNLSFWEMTDQGNFTCRKLCGKVTEYDVHIFWLTLSVYELFERPSYSGAFLTRGG